ncbi:hypothetical protein N7444_000178 [Penicillium canescens]|nr:hypothetical protein N7444_000178 [Penicillium canescens]
MTHFANTIIQQHGDIDSTPSQVFGKGNLILRIGNGGAGGVGLVEALAKDYLLLQKNQGRIEWICNHSRNTQLALLSGYVDIALTYEREQEEIAVSEGWAKNGVAYSTINSVWSALSMTRPMSKMRCPLRRPSTELRRPVLYFTAETMDPPLCAKSTISGAGVIGHHGMTHRAHHRGTSRLSITRPML